MKPNVKSNPYEQAIITLMRFVNNVLQFFLFLCSVSNVIKLVITFMFCRGKMKQLATR